MPVRDAIKADLGDEFPNLVVTIKGQKRAVLVRFGAPVTPGQTDFTADVIIALVHPSGTGLLIPNTRTDAAKAVLPSPLVKANQVVVGVVDSFLVLGFGVFVVRATTGKPS